MLPFSVILNACVHFCGTYLIVVIFACRVVSCRVSSLSVCVHRYGVLLNLVPFVLLLFLMYTHTLWDVFHGRGFSGSYFVIGCLCEDECLCSLVMICEL